MSEEKPKFAKTVAAEHSRDKMRTVRERLARMLPGIVGNPFIPHFPTPKQAVFLALRGPGDGMLEALYGGAAGGGKSDALLMAAAQFVDQKDYAGILFRRTHTDLAQPGALMDRSQIWWGQRAHWNGSDKIWTFPSGAKVALAYMSKPNDHLRYQGAEYQFTGWDELTQFGLRQYTYVALSRTRRTLSSVVPLRALCASNPGGEGHEWVRSRFVDERTREGRVYVPATLDDNPHVDAAAYRLGLQNLHPTVRQQLLSGDWTAREKGDYFRREWFGPPLDPDEGRIPSGECRRIRWWDLAASESEDACYTAGVKMLRTLSGWYAIEHARRFRATPGKRDDLIVEQARLDGKSCAVGIEIEPGSGGQAQFDHLAARLRKIGVYVIGERPTGDKASRCDPVAAELERGHLAGWQGCGIRLYAGAWANDYLDSVEGFPDSEHVDLADATSGAFGWLYLNAAGLQRAPKADSMKAKPRPAVDAPWDVHPEDRPPPEDPFRARRRQSRETW